MKPDSHITDPISVIADLHEWLDYNITQLEINLQEYNAPKRTKIYEQLNAYHTTLNKLEDLIDDYSN